MPNEHTLDDLRELQAVPLLAKEMLTRERIHEWQYYSGFGIETGVVSFSGGKDSTVLLHLCRKLYPNIPAVFSNTGLEYPEIQSFVKKHDNVTIVRPKMQFSEVISTYVYKKGIINTNYSFSSAVGMFNNITNIILLIIANQISKRVTKTSLF